MLYILHTQPHIIDHCTAVNYRKPREKYAQRKTVSKPFRQQHNFICACQRSRPAVFQWPSPRGYYFETFIPLFIGFLKKT